MGNIINDVEFVSIFAVFCVQVQGKETLNLAARLVAIVRRDSQVTSS
jgi:hypothetical protein